MPKDRNKAKQIKRKCSKTVTCLQPLSALQGEREGPAPWAREGEVGGARAAANHNQK